MLRCRFCGVQVFGAHTCESTGEHYEEDQLASFVMSAAIAAATDSAIIGGLLGGDIGGAILGDILDGDLMD